MNTAKKAASKSESLLVDDSEQRVVDKPAAQQVKPASASVDDLDRQNVKAKPAYASEAQNGAPSRGPKDELGMTAVVAGDLPADTERDDKTVRMVHRDGHEVDVNMADVQTHERAGWKKLKEDEA